MAPVTELPTCKAAVRAKGIQKVKAVNSTTLPTGGSIKTQRTSKAYLNKLETKVEAASTYSPRLKPTRKRSPSLLLALQAQAEHEGEAGEVDKPSA